MKTNNQIQGYLLNFAKSTGLNYLYQQDIISPSRDEISFVLVGSAATGLCRENSDVDLALVCDEEIYKIISSNTPWDKERPSEIIIKDVRLHYYGISFEKILSKLSDLDDIAFYIYLNVVILEDKKNKYQEEILDKFKNNYEVRKQRIEGKMDMLLRRSKALNYAIEYNDRLVIAKIVLEIMNLILKVIALLDDVQFDPRKRLYNTALTGTLGQNLSGEIRQIFHFLDCLGEKELEKDNKLSGLPDHIQVINNKICSEAEKQKFRVGLEKPDHRHL